jgi:hypothetical protein
MKASSLGRDLLRALRPLELASYLRARGWAEHQVFEGKGSVWRTTTESGEPVELIVATNPSLGDFASRMADAVATLEAFEGRSALEIVRDITTATADVLRIPATHAAFREGSIPVDLGVVLVQQARDLLLAAACAAVEPREVYSARRPTLATDYLQRARFGQTERGSYVLTVVSPVAPRLVSASSGAAEGEVDEPFERKVTLTLIGALQALSAATQRTAATGSFDALKGAVAAGVSANLCEALAGLSACCDPSTGVEVAVSWAPTRPRAGGAPTRVRIASDVIPIVREAARLFRETSPRPEFELRGMVVKLERDRDATQGSVTILGLVEDQLRRVEVTLNAEHYQVALRAHAAHAPVLCIGELRRRGTIYVLHYARHLALADVADAPAP